MDLSAAVAVFTVPSATAAVAVVSTVIVSAVAAVSWLLMKLSFFWMPCC